MGRTGQLDARSLCMSLRTMWICGISSCPRVSKGFRNCFNRSVCVTRRQNNGQFKWRVSGTRACRATWGSMLWGLKVLSPTGVEMMCDLSESAPTLPNQHVLYPSSASRLLYQDCTWPADRTDLGVDTVPLSEFRIIHVLWREEADWPSMGTKTIRVLTDDDSVALD
jgi:hypothetical protein